MITRDVYVENVVSSFMWFKESEQEILDLLPAF